ncbi:MAG: GNAT family N-acetyltransferase [Clostridia bacterium]|nr:GNAT family N-acetyltransferase [Clostridia bacterium]
MQKNLRMRPALTADAKTIASLYAASLAALHQAPVTADEWASVLSERDPDEEHYIIEADGIPAAWAKINGLQSEDTVWLSMLVVDPAKHRQGIGRFAVEAFEAVGLAREFHSFAIRTTADNLPARSLYRSCGYTETERGTFCYYQKTI